MSLTIVNIGLEVEFIDESATLFEQIESMDSGRFIINRTNYMPHVSFLFLLVDERDIELLRGRLPNYAPTMLYSTSIYRSNYSDTTVYGLNICHPNLSNMMKRLLGLFRKEILNTTPKGLQGLNYSHKEWLLRGIENNGSMNFHITLGDMIELNRIEPKQKILLKNIYLKTVNKYCTVNYDL